MDLQSIKQLPGRVVSFFWEYKFSILLVLYIYIISICPVGYSLSKPIFISCATFFFIFNILAKSNKYIRWMFNALLIIVISFNAYVAYTYSSWVSYGILFSVFNTTVGEASSMMGGELPAIALLIVIAGAVSGGRYVYYSDGSTRKVSDIKEIPEKF